MSRVVAAYGPTPSPVPGGGVATREMDAVVVCEMDAVEVCEMDAVVVCEMDAVVVCEMDAVVVCACVFHSMSSFELHLEVEMIDAAPGSTNLQIPRG